MDNICTSCLCAGRKLYNITETGFYDIYSNILHEIPVYNLPEICVRICWECRAVLHRFHVFKQRVKRSHTELLHYFSQPILPNFPPTNPPTLQIQLQHTTSYPEVKLEQTDCEDPVEVDLVIKEEQDCLQIESDDTHCEPVTFVHDLDVRGDNTVNKQTRKSKTPKVKAKKEKKTPKKNKAKITEDLKIYDHNSKTGENNASDYEDSAYVDSFDVEDCKTEKIVEGDVKVKEFICQDCDIVYGNIEELERHNQIAHIQTSDPKPVVVRVVNGARTNGAQTRVRVKEDLPDKPECVECGKQFSSKKTYRYHRNVIHRGQNQHPCPRCDKVFQWRSNLGRHMRSHKARDSGELYCKLCDKKFASVATYRQHLKLSKKHVDETQFNFMCNECGRKFVSKTRLRDHIDWEHLHKVKFRCQLCNKPFKCHTSLYVHRRAAHPATGERRAHLCHVCGKCYTNPNKLKYHIVAMHTHETPYKCTLCDTAFRWYSSLYRHTREVHYKMRLQPNRYKGKKPRKAAEQAPPEH